MCLRSIFLSSLYPPIKGGKIEDKTWKLVVYVEEDTTDAQFHFARIQHN